MQEESKKQEMRVGTTPPHNVPTCQIAITMLETGTMTTPEAIIIIILGATIAKNTPPGGIIEVEATSIIAILEIIIGVEVEVTSTPGGGGGAHTTQTNINTKPINNTKPISTLPQGINTSTISLTTVEDLNLTTVATDPI
jgi:molybdopterin-binding protein